MQNNVVVTLHVGGIELVRVRGHAFRRRRAARDVRGSGAHERLRVVVPLLMFCSVKRANIQKVARNASLQRTPLSHPLKICQKHE